MTWTVGVGRMTWTVGAGRKNGCNLGKAIFLYCLSNYYVQKLLQHLLWQVGLH